MSDNLEYISKKSRIENMNNDTETNIPNEIVEGTNSPTLNSINTDISNLPEAPSGDDFFAQPLNYRPKPEFLTTLYNEDDTYLTFGVKTNNTAAVKILLKLGADPNLPSRRGANPISLAAHRGNIEIMEALIIAGASVNAVNSSGSTALIQVTSIKLFI